MSRKIHIFALLFLTQFLIMQIAEAALLRSSGRGSKSGNFSQSFYFVEEQYLNEQGFIKADAFDFSAPKAVNSFNQSIGGGGRGVTAVPIALNARDDSCVNGYTQDEVDTLYDEENSAIIDFQNAPNAGDLTIDEYDAGIATIENDFAQQRHTLTVGTPCVWEFEQGETLNMFGFFGLYFGAAPIDYSVNWHIDGQVLEGAINTTGSTVATADGNIGEGWITLLDTIPAIDLKPGEYDIFATVNLSSNAGKFFWINGDPNDPVDMGEKCVDNPDFIAFSNDPTRYNDPDAIPPVEQFCGYTSLNSLNEISFSPQTFASESEKLRILAANTDPTSTVVNAPSAFGILLIGLGGLWLRIRTLTLS